MQVYLVGGAVRDTLLGLPYHERDWVVVGARPQQLIDQGFRQVGKDFPVFLHPQTKEEYALARTERKAGKGYHGFEIHSDPNVTLEEDLIRRDLTINAIAQDDSGNLIDPFDGQVDLQLRLLRHISAAFIEDPLRVLRVARFAARFYDLGFRIAKDTQTLMEKLSATDELDHLTPERIWKETETALATPHPEVYFQTLAKVGALTKIIPTSCSGKLPEDLSKLSSISQPKTRYIALCLVFCQKEQHIVDLEQLETMQDYYFAANELRTLCRLIAEHQLLSFDIHQHNAESLYQLINHLDALRRPQRFEELLEHLRQLDILSDTNLESSLQQLETIVGELLLIKLEPDQYDTLQGKALGDALQQLRLKKIQQLLASI